MTEIARKTKYNPVPLDTKQEIIETAKAKIMDGFTMAQIAHEAGITQRTLQMWLSALGDDYQELRQAWIDNILSDAAQKLDDADDQFPLAHAREQWKKATWYAERRDARYAAKQEQATVQINLVPPALKESAASLLDAITVPVLPNPDDVSDH